MHIVVVPQTKKNHCGKKMIIIKKNLKHRLPELDSYHVFGHPCGYSGKPRVDIPRYQLDDEPNLYIGNGWKSICPSIQKCLLRVPGTSEIAWLGQVNPVGGKSLPDPCWSIQRKKQCFFQPKTSSCKVVQRQNFCHLLVGPQSHSKNLPLGDWKASANIHFMNSPRFKEPSPERSACNISWSKERLVQVSGSNFFITSQSRNLIPMWRESVINC